MCFTYLIYVSIYLTLTMSFNISPAAKGESYVCCRASEDTGKKGANIAKQNYSIHESALETSQISKCYLGARAYNTREVPRIILYRYVKFRGRNFLQEGSIMCKVFTFFIVLSYSSVMFGCVLRVCDPLSL